jgi:hypothetical protein
MSHLVEQLLAAASGCGECLGMHQLEIVIIIVQVVVCQLELAAYSVGVLLPGSAQEIVHC